MRYFGTGSSQGSLTHILNLEVYTPHGEVVGSVTTDKMRVVSKIVRTVCVCM